MKVAIVGGGIIGLYIAKNLSEKGESVTLFERRAVVGKEACSGLLSQKILKFIPESQHLIENEIESVLIHFPKKTLRIEFSNKFFVINHAKLDNLVLVLAKKAGVKVVLNHNLTNPIRTLKRNFEKIIGCDGALSQTRKELGLKEPKFYLGIQGFVPQKDYSNFVETWPTKTGGFFWKIPRGEETEYGIIENVKTAKSIFKDFLEKKNIYLKKEVSALIPQALIIPSDNNVTLCGDSMGLTKPWSGGGVIWNLIAALILLKNFPDFLKYKKEVKKFFLSKIIFSKLAKKIIYSFGFNLPWILPKKYKIEGDFII